MASSIYLLDTHYLIWFQDDNPKMPPQALKEIQDPSNIILFSQVSLFEITIKQKIGKLPDFKATINDIYEQALKDNFIFLPLDNSHLYAYQKVPLLEQHRDPFDRLLIATALEENAIMMTVDKNFRLYKDIIQTFE